ncbi:MAG: diadenylate cyclase CdaA [Anaerolineales bacterium]|nr:diadenylate cyclase CdaA [Anaerolineales bacterium]
MSLLETLFADALFRLSSISWLQIVDLFLVTIVFYLLLTLVRQSRAAPLLRGAAVLILLLFVVTVFLPLPTFDWIVRAALLVILVGAPVLFQPEIRRFFEQLGRGLGRASFKRRAQETTLPPVMQAVQNLAASLTGALIVLEGSEDLDHIVDTGVPLNSALTSELLQTLFYDGTPLHDGAIVVRQDRVVAAGCVLPTSERQLYVGGRRLGMRHKAALGLSAVTDALIIVVSEETGRISAARRGQFHLSLDNAALREQLVDFYQPVAPRAEPRLTLWTALRQVGRQLRKTRRLAPHGVGAALGLGVLSLLLALIAWAFVTQQTNPVRQTRIDGIPLRLVDVPADTAVLATPPATVSALVKTTDALLPSLTPDSFQAVASLLGRGVGPQRLDVAVRSGVSPVRIIAVEPAVVDLELAEIVSRTLDVHVNLVAEHQLPAAYQVQGAPVVTPTQVTVRGAVPLVAQIDRVQLQVSLADATGPIQQTQPLVVIGENGQVLAGLAAQPAQAAVAVRVVRRPNAVDRGVTVPTAGTLPPGYRLRSIRTTPARLVLIGSDAAQLTAVSETVRTLPVDLSQLSGDFSADVPLVLPPGVQAQNGDGDVVVTVRVDITVAMQPGTLLLSRNVEILGEDAAAFTVSPATVDVQVDGPIPILQQIEARPGLVQVFVDTADLAAAEVYLTPQVSAPEAVVVRLVPRRVRINRQ